MKIYLSNTEVGSERPKWVYTMQSMCVSVGMYGHSKLFCHQCHSDPGSVVTSFGVNVE